MNLDQGAARRAMANARVGDVLPPDLLAPERHRRLAATAVILPGNVGLDDYRHELDAAAADFAAWDGAVMLLDTDRSSTEHRVVIVDRYGQVYDVTQANDASALPRAAAIEEWFKFLATACPECGVLDDPVATGPVP